MCLVYREGNLAALRCPCYLPSCALITEIYNRLKGDLENLNS